ncbi:hypothetical protein R1flu_002171 [Riccia fluitans]|uniref:Fe2OG dioxygenase domain-containing protein n=1 Tax=Riccia fluitans TaxID=41844 RepID=A0ABD1Y5C0_9MARC
MQEELLASIASLNQRTDCALTNVGILSVLLQGCCKLPQVYVQPEEDRIQTSRKEAKHSSPCADQEESIRLPLIDISVFESYLESDPRRSEMLAKIVESSRTWGFIQVVGHGVDLELIKASEEEAHRLFQLPVSVKQNALRLPGSLFGYGANFWLNLPAMNWAESFSISKSNAKEYAAKLLPNHYERFSNVMEEYIRQVEGLGHRFRRILTEGLGLPANHFDRYFGPDETEVNLRLNFYPPCPEPSKALGLKAHRDPHFLTLLHQDDTGGLQIWNEARDEWFNVKPIPNSFVINVGDMLQAASNGICRSVLHRAVVNESRSRLSMACFYNTGATIVAPDELITSERPQKYRPFSWKEYVKEAYTYTTGAVSQFEELYSI